ncbi:MAG: hypothetical protein SNJ84_04875 [Verrucomicrobiia bacterium]
MESRAESVVAPPDLGVEVSFLPDPHGAESMARQIRSTCLAYPVFELAKVALKKEARHHVVLKRRVESGVSLFRCTLDGTVWLDRVAGAAHVTEHYLDVFYEEEEVACDPPKGNFNALGVCSLDGTVLGPVNHHDYGANVRRLYQRKFGRMSFEEFKAHIQIVRDAEKIEAWRQSQSVKTVYVARPTPVLPQEAKEEETVSVVPLAESKGEPESVVEAVSEEAGKETVIVPEPQGEGVAEVATAELTVSEEGRGIEGEGAAVPSESAGRSEPTPPQAGERLGTLVEVKEHFLRTHAEGFLVPVDEVVLETVEARRRSAPELAEQIRFALQQELRFPLKTAKVLIRQLGRFGLQFFKWGKGATFVSGIRPRRFESDPAALSDGVRAVFEWVVAHPNGRREQLFKAMSRREPNLTQPETESEGGAVVEQTREETAPPGAMDLLWLVREGYVIAFADGRLDLIRSNPKKVEPRPKAEGAGVAVVELGTEQGVGGESGSEMEAKAPAQIDPVPADPSDDPEAEREGAGDEPA